MALKKGKAILCLSFFIFRKIKLVKTANRLAFIFILFLFISSSFGQDKQARYKEFINGYDNFNGQHYDSAFSIFSRYIDVHERDVYTAWAYTYLGHIYWQAGDLYASETNLVEALSILDSVKESKRKNLPGYLYNLLGNVNLDLGRYKDAIRFYDNALPFFEGKEYAIEIMNGEAVAFQRMKDYTKAIATYNFALTFKPRDRLLVARILDNRARTEWLRDSNYSASNEFHAALKIRLDSNYNEGLTASYDHLADYYAIKNPDSALLYARRMYNAGIACENVHDIANALDKLSIFSSDPDTIKKWHTRYKNLNDNIQFAKDTSQGRFGLQKYDPRKSKVDNLFYQKKISTQRDFMIRLGIIATAIILFLTIWYNIRRRKLKRESEIAIRDSKLKTSQRVHDVVANGLYGIMNELEHRPTIDREPLMNRIEDLYEKSRDISYEESPATDNTNYDTQVHELLNSFSTDQTNVYIVGNQPAFWNKITGAQKRELQLVLNEIMVNMKKHSRAQNVVIRFKQEDGIGWINYTDDGIGFDENIDFGNGLKNTVSRINSLTGEVTFEKNEKGGLAIIISLPIQSEKL